MKFKVGDMVKIRNSSQWYGMDIYNPSDTIGVIMIIEDNFIRMVKWGNGYYGSAYSSKHLEIAGYTVNALNKLLYPEYVESNGLLVPNFSNK